MSDTASVAPRPSGAGRPAVTCPACREPTTGMVICPRCGLAQVGPEVDALRDLDRRLHEVNARLNALATERRALDDEGNELLATRSEQLAALRQSTPVGTGAGWAPPEPAPPAATPTPAPMPSARGLSTLPPPPPLSTLPPPPPLSTLPPPPFAARPAPRRREVRPVTTRSALLVVGALLLALAAVLFVAVSWPPLGAMGQAATLIGITVLALGVSLGLKRRLPATAEAIAALFLAFLLVDWQALHTAGADEGIDPFAWWALGTAGAAAFACALAATARFQVARFATVLLGPTAAVLALAWMVHDRPDPGWGIAIGGAALAALMLVVTKLLDTDRSAAWRPAAALLAVVASGLWLAAGLAALVEVSVSSNSRALASGIAIASVAFPPAAARVLFAERVCRAGAADLLVGVSTLILLTALTVATAGVAHGHALIAVCAWLAVATLLVARLARPLRVGSGAVGASVLVLAALDAVAAVGVAAFSPLSWLGRAWSGDPLAEAATHLDPNGTTALPIGWAAVVILAAAAAGALVARVPLERFERLVSTRTAVILLGAAAWGTLVVVPVLAGASILGALLIGLGAAAAFTALALGLERQGISWWPWMLAIAGLTLVPVVGWAAVAPWLTVTALGVMVVLTAAAAAVTRSEAVRVCGAALAAGALIAEAATVTAALDASNAAVGFAAVMAAAIVFVAGWHLWRDRPVGWSVQAMGALGTALGLFLPTSEQTTGAAATRTTGFTFSLTWWFVASFGVTALGAVAGLIRRTDPAQRMLLAGVAAASTIAAAGLAVATGAGETAWTGLTVTATSAALLTATLIWRTRADSRAVQAVGTLGAVVGWLITITWWDAGGRWWVVAATAVITLAATAAAAIPREPLAELRIASAGTGAAGFIASVGLAASAAGGTRLAVALAFAVPAGLVLVAGALGLPGRVEGTTLEALGGVGLLAALGAANADATLVSGPTKGTAATHDQLVASAAVFSTAVPAFALAGLRVARFAYRWASAGAAVVALWLFLAAFDIDVVEAYTLPAAAVALAAGYLNRHTEVGSNSWLAYGPGLAIGLGPSLVLAIGPGQVARPLILLVVGAVVVGIGVWHKLQAPLVIGVVTLLTLAVDTLGPSAARLPKWVFLAIIGAAFIWLGATIEHRLRDLRHARDAFGHLH